MAGMETVIGSQIPLDAATIAEMLASLRLRGREQDLGARGQDIQARGQDVQLAIAQAEFDQRGQEALQQYELDLAQFGLDKARELYNQRLGVAQMELAASSEGSNQRQARATTKLDSLKLLGSMRGPSDWVGYNTVLNGLAAPTGELVDPTKFADDIVDPRFEKDSGYDWTAGMRAAEGNLNAVAAPRRVLTGAGAQVNRDNIGRVGAWGNGDQFLGVGQGGGFGGGGGGGGSQPNIMRYPGQETAPRGLGTWEDPQTHGWSEPDDPNAWSGIKNETVAYLKPGDMGFHTTGTLGPSRVSDYAGFGVYRDPTTQYGANDLIDPGSAIYLKKLNAGGTVNDKAAIVGEGASAEDLGDHGEIMINETGAPITILDNKTAKAFLKEHMAGHMDGDAGDGKKRGKKSGLPKHATGTVTDPGFYGVDDPNKMQFLQYDPSVIGSMPVMDTLRRGQVRGGKTFGGFGGNTLSNPGLGITDAPTQVNLQGIRDLDPSARDMTQSIYEQGLKVDFRDLLERARRAAPIGVAAGTKTYR